MSRFRKIKRKLTKKEVNSKFRLTTKGHILYDIDPVLLREEVIKVVKKGGTSKYIKAV